MNVAQHIGIVGCSAPGAALCYQTICMEGTALLTENQIRPEVSMHTSSIRGIYTPHRSR